MGSLQILEGVLGGPPPGDEPPDGGRGSRATRPPVAVCPGRPSAQRLAAGAHFVTRPMRLDAGARACTGRMTAARAFRSAFT